MFAHHQLGSARFYIYKEKLSNSTKLINFFSRDQSGSFLITYQFTAQNQE